MSLRSGSSQPKSACVAIIHPFVDQLAILAPAAGTQMIERKELV